MKNLCPCGTTISFDSCCGLYLSDKAIPPNPEALMRSRYTAYSMANIDYIKKTMRGKPRIGFSATNAKQWAKSVTWLGLNVIQSHFKSDEIGFVEFVSTYSEHETTQTIHEISEFHKIKGRWYYVDGQTL